MATFYLDLENGNDANNGTSWALAWKTFTTGATAARIAPGDVIRVAKTADPTSIGNATWTSRSSTVTLATAQTATIDNCETAWTAANTATVTRTNTTVKQGIYSAQIVTPASTATSTLYAYFAVGGAGGLDLSAYQQITFWFYNATTAVADANRYQIKLCSDTAGATAVDTFDIPAVSSTNQWVPLVITKTGGGNLGNAIKSIALYTGTSSPGNTQTIRLDNFSASTTNGLNLQSLLSKNSTADFTLNDAWWCLASIDGTSIRLGGANVVQPVSQQGYYTEGTSTETVTTYIRKSYYTTATQTVQDNGTSGNLITFSGGWDTVSNTRTGMTYIDSLNNSTDAITINGKFFVKLEYFGLVRASSGIRALGGANNITTNYMYGTGNLSFIETSGANNFIDNVFSALNQTSCTLASTAAFNTVTNYKAYSSNTGISNQGRDSSFSDIIVSNNVTGLSSSVSTQNNNTFTNITARYNTLGILCNASNNVYTNITITNSTTNAVTLGLKDYFYNFTASSNATTILTGGNATNFARFNNVNISDTTLLSSSTNTVSQIAFDNYSGVGRLYTKEDGAVSAFTWNAIQQNSVTKTGSGYAWQVNVLTNFVTSTKPAKLTVATIAVNSGTAVTVKAWVKKTHATNISAALVVPNNTIPGVSTNVTANKSNDTNWEELTVSFTPSFAGVAEIQLWTWSTTGSVSDSSYIDSMTVTQV